MKTKKKKKMKISSEFRSQRSGVVCLSMRFMDSDLLVKETVSSTSSYIKISSIDTPTPETL